MADKKKKKKQPKTNPRSIINVRLGVGNEAVKEVLQKQAKLYSRSYNEFVERVLENFTIAPYDPFNPAT